MLSFEKTYQLPFKFDIPNYIKSHIEEVSFLKRALKFFRRYLYIFLKRQKKLEIFSILPHHKNILWINISAPSLGDSLMDLSSRVLLEGRQIDLFTDLKNNQLYLNDEHFNNVYTRSKDLKNIIYDLIIIDSYSSRSIKIKTVIAPKTHFVGIYGYFNGPEVNRILFSFHKMNHLLSYHRSENEINSLAKNSISISEYDYDLINNVVPKKYIAIVLGGEWQYKIYNKWDEVIEKITFNDKELSIIFIGSANAKRSSYNLLKKFPQQHILDFVERLSFNQSVEVIRRADILLCCDGGLMHAANAVGANIISLFARLTPEMLTTETSKSNFLFDKKDVNNIPSKEVVNKYFKVNDFTKV